MTLEYFLLSNKLTSPDAGQVPLCLHSQAVLSSRVQLEGRVREKAVFWPLSPVVPWYVDFWLLEENVFHAALAPPALPGVY